MLRPPAPETAGKVWVLRVAAAVLAVLGVVPLANFVTFGEGLPWWSSTVWQWLAWAVIVASAALILGTTIAGRIEAAVAWAERVLLWPSSRTFAVIAGISTCLLALYFGWRLFGLEPVVGDEFAQRWQAHLLTKGRLFALADAHPEFFSTNQTLELRGRWFSQFPVGGPAILSLGSLLGVPWLINPLLAGIGAIAFYDLVASIADQLTARLSAALFALSPFVLFMSGSQMNHVGTLTCLLLALAALARWFAAENAARAGWAAVVIGASLGVAATIRPFDAAVVALMIGIFQLHAIRTKPALLRSLIGQCIAGAIPLLVLFGVNNATVGRPFAFAYDVLNGPEHRPGFHMTPLGFEHTPVRGLYMASAYLMKLDVGLFGWPVPAVLVIVATLGLQRRATRWDYLLLAILGGVLIGYGAYWSESYFLGPRFLYTAVPVFVFYTARMTTVLRDRIHQPTPRAAALLLVPLWVLVAWLAPAQDDQLFGVLQRAKLYKMGSAAATIRSAVQSAGITHAVVFLPEGWHSRLASRLRALGVRPLAAEQVVAHADACRLQQALDAADTVQEKAPGDRARYVLGALADDAVASPLGRQAPNEQIAIVPGRPMSAECQEELRQTLSRGVSLAAMLPYADLDANGRLGGEVVYARDFGWRNALLRPQYGDRRWYAARASFVGAKLKISLVPIH